MTDYLLKLDNLSVGYSEPVCTGISAEVEKGGLVGLCGKNGSGKSTLIRSLLGLQPLLSGSIKMFSEDLKNSNLRERAKKIAVVFSRLSQVPAISVYDLTALGRLPYTNGLSKLSMTDRNLVDNSLELVGITHLKSKMATQLSDGQLQMVMIARALAQDTELIVMDEPTSHLDYENQFKIFELIYKLSKETQKTFIVASHQLELIAQNANQLWWIENGMFYAGFTEQLAFEQRIFEKQAQQKIKFDYKSGNFQFTHSVKNYVNMKVENTEFNYWLRHALERNGVGLSENSDLKITTSAHQIFVNKLKFENIETLINYLKNKQQ